LLRLQARQLRPDRGDEKEGDHASEQVDVGDEVEFGVEWFLATLAACIN
jgi:hypothetical protein